MMTGAAVSLSGCGENKSSSSNSGGESDDGKKPSLAQNTADGSILQTFSWDFNTIRESMPDIAAAGFSAIQTSPVNACLAGEGGGMELYGDGKWYYHYQRPTSQ